MPPSPIVGIVGDTPDAGLDNPATADRVHADARRTVLADLHIRDSHGRPTRSVTWPRCAASCGRRSPRSRFETCSTMDAVLHDSVAPARLSMRLIGAFAIVALITAALGVFGVLSFVVAQRTRELGIRMALGAAPGDVRRLVVGYGSRLAMAGLVIGLLGSFALTRLIATMLFGVAPTDPLTFGTVSADPVRHRHPGELAPGASRYAHRPDHGASVRLAGHSERGEEARSS